LEKERNLYRAQNEALKRELEQTEVDELGSPSKNHHQTSFAESESQPLVDES